MSLGNRNDRQLQESHVRYFYYNFRIFRISHFIHDFASLSHYSTFAFYTLSISHFRTFALLHFISRPVPTYAAWWQRHIGVWNWPKVFTPRARPRLEPTTSWSQVRRSTKAPRRHNDSTLKTQQMFCFQFLSHLLGQTPALHCRSSVTQCIAFFIFRFLITNRFTQIRSHVTCSVNDIQSRLCDYRNTSINTYFTCINKYPPLHFRCALCCYGWTVKPPTT